MSYIKILLLALVFLLPAASADARITILPRKVVLEPRDRSGEITILNLFNEPSLYRISFIHYRQRPDGTYETLEAPLNPVFDPENIVRISPRQFQLPSEGRQKIRMSLRKPADLPDGEYRFHLLAQRYPVEDANGTAADRGVAINMQMNMGVSIPVVVRHGDLSARADIASAQYLLPSQSEHKTDALQVTVSRQGNASTVGNLSIYSGEERLGYIDNFNIFTEINERTIEVPLTRDPRGQGPLRIVYQDDDDRIFDETTFTP